MRVRGCLVVVSAAMALAACGAAPVVSAGAQAPSLQVALTNVDASLAHGQYALARARLLQLIDGARAAQEKGSISPMAAARIISAARALLATLPHTVSAATAPQIAPQPTVSSAHPSARPTTTITAKPSRPPQTPAARPSPTPPSSPTPTPAPAPSPTAPPTSSAASSPSP